MCEAKKSLGRSVCGWIEDHSDPSTGLPYDAPNAAVGHMHAYDPTGKVKVVSPNDGNPYFLLQVNGNAR